MEVLALRVSRIIAVNVRIDTAWEDEQPRRIHRFVRIIAIGWGNQSRDFPWASMSTSRAHSLTL